MTRQEYAEYRARFEALNDWEARQPPIERPPAEILADLGLLLGFVSEEERRRDPDPEKLGIQPMRAILALGIGSR